MVVVVACMHTLCGLSVGRGRVAFMVLAKRLARYLDATSTTYSSLLPPRLYYAWPGNKTIGAKGRATEHGLAIAEGHGA